MKKKVRIGIYSDSQAMIGRIENSIFSDGNMIPVLYRSVDQLVEDCRDNYIHGITFATDFWCKDQMESLDKILKSFSKTPVVTLESEISNYCKAKSDAFKKVHNLKDPEGIEDLPGVLIRMIGGLESFHRESPRRSVPLTEVAFLKDGMRGNCLLTDLSQGGGGAIVQSNELNKGDIVCLNVPVGDSLNLQSVRAQVRWEQKIEGPGGDLTRVGFQFEQVVAQCA